MKRIFTITSFGWIAIPTAIALLACFGYWAYGIAAAYLCGGSCFG